ncbi:hypothetical protein C8Q73DRAFT_664607 [Cubamyces lactineus]|nr:hypothetical protein C8Q73DRAFT_664607 [Cubamyces lactineus]
MSYQTDMQNGSDNTQDANINHGYIHEVYANYIPPHGSFAHTPNPSSVPALLDSQQQQLEGGHQGGWHTHIHRPLATQSGHGMYTEHQCYPYGPINPGFDEMMHSNQVAHGRNEHTGYVQHGTTPTSALENGYVSTRPATYHTTPNPIMQQSPFAGPPIHRDVHATYANAPTRVPHLHPLSASPPLARSPTNDPTSTTGIRCEWAGGCGQTIANGAPAGIRGHLKDHHFTGGAPAAKDMLQCLWGSECRRDPMQWENIPKHIAECHLKTMRRQCGDCGADFARSDTLTRHQLASSCPRGRGTAT